MLHLVTGGGEDSMKISLLLAGLCFALTAFAVQPDVVYLYDLTRTASYDGLALHSGKVWAGIDAYSVSDPAGSHRVVVFDVNDPQKAPDVIRVPHAPQFIYPFGKDKVMVVGLTAYGNPARWQSHYSEILRDGSGYRVSTHDFPDGYESGNSEFPGAIFVKQFAQLGNRMFFSLQYGENGLMEWSKSAPRKLAPRIQMPDQVLPVENSLYVIERDNIDNITRVDLSDEKATRLLPQGTDVHFNRMLWVPKEKLLVAAEKTKLMLVSHEGFKVKQELPLDVPNGLAELGSCVIVTAEQTRKLHFIDLSGGQPRMVDTWDLSGLGIKFENAKSVVADAPTGRVFVRSTRACPYCQHSPNGLVMAEDRSGQIKKDCHVE